MSSMTGIPSPLWTENKRLETANAELRARVAELEAQYEIVCRENIALHQQVERDAAQLAKAEGILAAMPREAVMLAMHIWLKEVQEPRP